MADAHWGFATSVVGVTGGSIPFRVTTPADNGERPPPGSLRQALSQPGRYITFASDMAIGLVADLSIPDDTTIDGGRLRVHTHGFRWYTVGKSNIRVQNIGSYPGDTSTAIAGTLDCMGFSLCDLVEIDRCSFAFSKDELIDCENCSRVTIQRSVLAAPLHLPRNPHSGSGHALGGRLNSGTKSRYGGISFLKNLVALVNYRPNIYGEAQLEGNVVYGVGHGSNFPPVPTASHPFNVFPTPGQVTKVDIRDNRFIESIDANNDGIPHRAIRINGGAGEILWYVEGNTFLGIGQPPVPAPVANAGNVEAQTAANFETLHAALVRDPRYLKFKPELHAGPRNPDNVVLAVREHVANRTGKVIDHPEELIPNGLGGVL